MYFHCKKISGYSGFIGCVLIVNLHREYKDSVEFLLIVI